MRKFLPLTFTFMIAASAWVAACGSSADAPAGSDIDGSGSNGQGSSNGTGGVVLGSGASNGLGGDGAGTGSVGSWGGASCADANSGGNLEPVYLVFLVDQSGSMGDNCNGAHYAARWEPTVNALNVFFADADSAGLYASLTLFPTETNPGENCGNDTNLKCDAGSYDTPEVNPTKLPNATVFANALDIYPNEYGTPTYPALGGTVTYAKTLKAEGKKVAIVMVTDGQPQFCGGDNTVANTAAQAADALAAGIPTYVLGVGDSITDLDSIAEAGGTVEATIASEGTPEETQAKLLGKINEIRGAQVSCELTIPDPPAGKTLDPAKVTLEYTTGGKTTSLLNTDCSGDKTGWHYDDATNPTKIELCSATCDDVSAHADAALNVVFGCEVAIIDPK